MFVCDRDKQSHTGIPIHVKVTFPDGKSDEGDYCDDHYDEIAVALGLVKTDWP